LGRYAHFPEAYVFLEENWWWRQSGTNRSQPAFPCSEGILQGNEIDGRASHSIRHARDEVSKRDAAVIKALDVPGLPGSTWAVLIESLEDFPPSSTLREQHKETTLS
jgi:hypothetical protein